MDEFAELQAKLESLTHGELQNAERKALGAVGKLIQNAIKGRAPVQSGEYAGGVLKPGELAANIKARVHVASDQGITTGDVSNVKVGPTDEGVAGIAAAIENGHLQVTGGRNGKGGRVVGHVPAHPFVRPAIDAVQDEAVELYQDTMTAEITAVMER